MLLCLTKKNVINNENKMHRKESGNSFINKSSCSIKKWKATKCKNEKLAFVSCRWIHFCMYVYNTMKFTYIKKIKWEGWVVAQKNNIMSAYEEKFLAHFFQHQRCERKGTENGSAVLHSVENSCSSSRELIWITTDEFDILSNVI